MTSAPLTDRLAYGVDELATLVGVSTSSIRRLIKSGVLAKVPYTDRVLISRTEVDRWLNATGGQA